jgi:hypothetical protein
MVAFVVLIVNDSGAHGPRIMIYWNIFLWCSSLLTRWQVLSPAVPIEEEIWTSANSAASTEVLKLQLPNHACSVCVTACRSECWIAYSGSICNAMWLTGRDLNMYLVRGPKHRLAVLFWSWLLTCLVIGHSPCSCFLWQNRATEMSKVSACFHLYQQAHWCVT